MIDKRPNETSETDSQSETSNPSPPVRGVPETDLRVQLAAERTLLAWIRTGLALMAFGFVVAKFALILQSLGIETDRMLKLNATVIGILLVALGILVNISAPMHYQNYFRRIDRDSKTNFTASWLTFFVAYSLAIVGIGLVIYLFLVHWN